MNKHTKINPLILAFAGLLFLTPGLLAQDPDFYIYLCFGQSNMQGQGEIQNKDKKVDERFKTFQALDCPNLSRTKATWYTAVPPTCQCYSLFSPADYFGRTMVANLPDSITVGIINVSVAGCDIRLFDKDIYQDYDSTYTESWFTNLVAGYDWNPYQYLVNLAKLAQNDGIIKGVLLHQGETNTGDVHWPSYVKKIYYDMLTDLSLDADSVPLLAGELLSVPGNCCASMNPIINRLPDTIPTAYVISSSDCTGQDEAHFDTEGYRKLGRRYAVQMLSLMGYEAVYSEAECSTVGGDLYIRSDKSASNSAYVTAIESSPEPPAADAKMLIMNVSVSADTNYTIYGRFKNADNNHDSFWLKADEGEFELYDNMITTGWEWLELKSLRLTEGEHTLRVAFAEDSVMLDKVVVKNAQIKPVDVGEEAANLCEAEITSGFMDAAMEGYALGQNYPNPVTDGNIIIPFKIPNTGYVSLKIYNSLGMDIDEPARKVFGAGEHAIEYNPEKLSPGIYIYTMKTDTYAATRKMIITAR